MTYAGLDFDQAELSAVMRQTYAELIEFLRTPAFVALHKELRALPREQRPAFVANVLLQPAELAARGVVVPDGVLVQMSAFGDRRPTLFAVKKFLPEKYQVAWQNVNFTFDQEFVDSDVSREPDKAWRAPLPVQVQNAAMERGIDLEAIEVP